MNVSSCVTTGSFVMTSTLFSRFVLAVLLSAVVNAAGADPLPFKYSNPLPFHYTEGQSAVRDEVRDPCIIQVDGTYYLVFTMFPFRNYEPSRVGEPDQGGSPGIGLYSSRDLKSWKFENWLVKSSELPEQCPYKDRFWAPEIHRINGKFYLIFTADNWRNGAASPTGKIGTAGYAFIGVSDKVNGPYQHITYIEGGACDTTLFADESGQTYVAMPKDSVYVRKIDLSALGRGVVKLVGEEKLAVAKANTDIGHATSPDYLEGPWVERIGKRYYLFHAAIYRKDTPDLTAGYWTNVAYADSPLGPWKKDARAQLFCGGHLAVFDGPGGSTSGFRTGESRPTVPANGCA